MIHINTFQKFKLEQQFRNTLHLESNLAIILDYCEYSIRSDFNEINKQKMKIKSKIKNYYQQFQKAFLSLNKQQKIEYYGRIIGFIRNFTNNINEPPKSSFSGILSGNGYSRSFSIKRWKGKKLKLDQDRHIMFAQRDSIIKTYQLKDYLLRISKNKEYISFVLQAINKNPPQRSRTVHIGFTDKAIFQQWYQSIKFSIQFNTWQFYRQLYFDSQALSSSINVEWQIGKSYLQNEKKYNDQNNKIRQGGKDQNLLSKSLYIHRNHEYVEDFQLSDKKNYKQKENKIIINKLKIQKKQRQKQQLEKQIKQYQNKKQQIYCMKTLVDDLIDGQNFVWPDIFQDRIQQQDQKSKKDKKNLDLFHKIYPEYQLQQLQMYTNYTSLHDQPNFKIYQHQILQKRVKMVINFDKSKYSSDLIISLISKAENMKYFNENIQQIQIKTNIPSQNSALMYMILKPFNRLYRSRDFIFIRHVFKSNNIIYMIDKSIQNTNYPPFMTIVRGQLCIVYGIFQRQNKYQMIVDIQIINEGLLNILQQTNLTLKYIKCFNKLLEITQQCNSYKFFDLEWDINKNYANQLDNEIRSRKKTIKQINKDKQIASKQNQNFSTPTKNNFIKKKSYQQQHIARSEKIQARDKSYQKTTSLSPNHISSPIQPKKVILKKLNKNQMDQVGQMTIEQVNEKQSNFSPQVTVIRNLDHNGNVIIEDSYLKHRYILSPIEKSASKIIFMDNQKWHPIWKNDWIHDDKDGGIIFINQKKIQDQKGVLRFILSKMAKNLVSGQSILNISLPVDIFGPESNLQRFVFSMVYAPLLFEQIQSQTIINKLLKAIIFGITNSTLYLSMEKPFNPIIGETFQCWINGCPAYAEQISHHPPVGALILKGRGYQISAQLESKISVGVNSGTGTNDGVYRIKFDDGIQICFITPGGEVSGLAHGDRKFNLVGKSHYWIKNSNIVLELIFDPFKKGFFSVGKQIKPSDYFEGVIWEVKPEFMEKFINGKRKEPDQKQRTKCYGKISGIWNQYVSFNDEEIFNFNKSFPLVLEFQPNPLPSDSNWREDIEYRKRNQVTRAQTQKQKFELLQRKDRKLREKYNKKK